MKQIEHETLYPKEKIKDYNIIIDGRIFINKPVNNDARTFENIEKLPLVKDIVTKLVLHGIIVISKKTIRLVTVNLSKQQAFNADPKAI